MFYDHFSARSLLAKLGRTGYNSIYIGPGLISLKGLVSGDNSIEHYRHGQGQNMSPGDKI